jgi:hypothetical protein
MAERFGRVVRYYARCQLEGCGQLAVAVRFAGMEAHREEAAFVGDRHQA